MQAIRGYTSMHLVLIMALATLAGTGCWEDPFASSGGGGGGGNGEVRDVANAQAVAGKDKDKDKGEHDKPSPPEPEQAPPEPVVALNPARADLSGSAQYKCWDDGCYWVVWCGHKICDGSWSWTFPSSGVYRVTWEAVKEKCAGSPAYELRVNGESVAGGRLAQYGSCSDCAARRGYGVFVNRELGSFEINEGDTVTLWVRNDFACGMNGPGAYAAHDALRADLQQ